MRFALWLSGDQAWLEWQRNESYTPNCHLLCDDPDNFCVRKDTRNERETQPLRLSVYVKNALIIVNLQGGTSVLRKI